MWEGAAAGHGEEPKLDSKTCACPGERVDVIPKPELGQLKSMAFLLGKKMRHYFSFGLTYHLSLH